MSRLSSFPPHVSMSDMPTFSPRCFHGLVAVMVIGVPACSDKSVKKVTVSGTISYQGRRIPSGMLQFVGPNGAYSAAVIQPDGTFIITDVVLGEVKVGVLEAPRRSGSSSSGEKPVPGPKAAPASLPDKFRNPETSGLKYTITSETRELHISIE